MVDRCAAEAYFVVEIPKTLNSEIEQMMPQYCAAMMGFA